MGKWPFEPILPKDQLPTSMDLDRRNEKGVSSLIDTGQDDAEGSRRRCKPAPYSMRNSCMLLAAAILCLNLPLGQSFGLGQGLGFHGRGQYTGKGMAVNTWHYTWHPACGGESLASCQKAGGSSPLVQRGDHRTKIRHHLYMTSSSSASNGGNQMAHTPRGRLPDDAGARATLTTKRMFGSGFGFSFVDGATHRSPTSSANTEAHTSSSKFSLATSGTPSQD